MKDYYQYCKPNTACKLEITSIDGQKITHDRGFDSLCDLSSKLAEKGCQKYLLETVQVSICKPHGT